MTQAMLNGTSLNSGTHMPWLGLGVWQVEDGSEVEQAVKAAIAAGYRSIDTAAMYGNEGGVGRAIRESGVPRDQLFVTTKLANGTQKEGRDAILRGFDESLEKLQLEYVDLYLVHWPIEGHYEEAWRTLVELYKDGRARAVGVSNFTVDHLNRILHADGVVPAVNQVEFHPFLTRERLHAFCREHRIQLEAYSPLMQGNVDVPLFLELAEKYGKTPAQIVLRWNVQKEVVTIPKSTHAERIRENAAIFDFELTPEEMTRIDGLNRNHRYLVNNSPDIVSDPY